MPTMAAEIFLEYTEEYLKLSGINTRKAFRCLNPSHEDKHPSMSFNKDAGNVHCFSCGVSYDLIDIVGMDYNLHTFAEKYAKTCDLFGIVKPNIKPINYLSASSGEITPNRSTTIVSGGASGSSVTLVKL